MGLIKSGMAPTRLVPFSLKDIEQQARAIVTAARDQADALLAAAQQEAQRLCAEASQSGQAEGHRLGNAEGLTAGAAQGKDQALAEQREKLASLIQTLGEVLIQIDAERSRLSAEATADVVRLAITIARKVCNLYGSADPKCAIANVEHAVSRVVAAADLRVAVHPSQHKALQDVLADMRLRLPVLQHAQIVDDATLAPGGCRIHTAGGLIDADLNQQIDIIAAEMLSETETVQAPGTSP
jgi:flagellar assembly protein FliH